MSYNPKFKTRCADNVKFVNDFNKLDMARVSASSLNTFYKTLPKLPAFEDAVNVKNQKRELKSSRPSLNLSQKKKKIKNISLEEVPSLMKSCIRSIEDKSPTALLKIKTFIHYTCDYTVTQAMTLWKDEYELNILHYAIINNRPEIISYLLAKSAVFPPDSQPSICPYAHLAAYLGATDSLKVILTERPSDYFKSQLSFHDIKLPDHIIQRFRLKAPKKKQKRNFDEVLKSINAFKKSEESWKMPDKVESDNLSDLVTHLQIVYADHSDMKKSILPPINPLNRGSYVGQRKIIKPRAYDKLFSHANDTEITTFLEKTPLALAAERCNADTVDVLLEILFSRKYHRRKSHTNGPLLWATKLQSPEAITALLEFRDISSSDYQDSVLESIRQMLPDCLIALLSNPPKGLRSLFGGMSLFHILYTQSLYANDERYQLLPSMTRALLYCKEDVNSYTIRQTFPLYSLISSSFNVSSTKNLYHTFECLWILLKAGANPYFVETSKHHFDEEANKTIIRQAYTSMFNCIFKNTSKSLESHENPGLTLVIMKNSLLFALNLARKECLKLNKHYMDFVLFEYLEKACIWGLDKQILTKILSSGINPNAKIEKRYAINNYFGAFFKYVLESKIHQTQDYYKKEMGILMILCQQMSPQDLREAAKIILNQYVQGIPAEAVAVTRYFLYLVDSLVKHTYFKTRQCWEIR